MRTDEKPVSQPDPVGPFDLDAAKKEFERENERNGRTSHDEIVLVPGPDRIRDYLSTLTLLIARVLKKSRPLKKPTRTD